MTDGSPCMLMQANKPFLLCTCMFTVASAFLGFWLRKCSHTHSSGDHAVLVKLGDYTQDSQDNGAYRGPHHHAWDCMISQPTHDQQFNYNYSSYIYVAILNLSVNIQNGVGLATYIFVTKIANILRFIVILSLAEIQ